MCLNPSSITQTSPFLLRVKGIFSSRARAPSRHGISLQRTG
jgi:hypothetical protein